MTKNPQKPKGPDFGCGTMKSGKTHTHVLVAVSFSLYMHHHAHSTHTHTDSLTGDDERRKCRENSCTGAAGFACEGWSKRRTEFCQRKDPRQGAFILALLLRQTILLLRQTNLFGDKLLLRTPKRALFSLWDDKEWRNTLAL